MAYAATVGTKLKHSLCTGSVRELLHFVLLGMTYTNEYDIKVFISNLLGSQYKDILPV